MSLKHTFLQYLKRFGAAEKNENNVSKAYILTVFETIWSCREKMKTMYLKHTFLQYLKRFGAAEKILKTMYLKHTF